ncbi:unnamed protein product [Schistocephalus solidus]|uniref:Endonuclease/exonuclease/phosphatase domain-containing protein n=1 Tax=Schistocephalus solidus TaxID=70667 RepID=A0A183TLC9_SCHSO|nr:unnamed protein product [Schistocephalus solidus]
MLLWPPLTGTQLSPVAPQSWVLPSGHTPDNRNDRRAKPGEGLRCCVCLHTRHAEERLTGVEDGASLSGTGALQVGHRSNQQNLKTERTEDKDLQLLQATAQKMHKLIVLSEFNARVGTHHATRRGALGPHDFDGFNENNLLLPGTRVEHRLILTNTFLRPRMRQTANWMHPQPGTGTCRIMPRPKWRQRLASLPFTDEDAAVENRWIQLRDTLQSTAMDILNHAFRQHQDWFDGNHAAINTLLAQKNRLHKAYIDRPTDANKAAFSRSHRHVQERLWEMQDAWIARKAEDRQRNGSSSQRSRGIPYTLSSRKF